MVKRTKRQESNHYTNIQPMVQPHYRVDHRNDVLTKFDEATGNYVAVSGGDNAAIQPQQQMPQTANTNAIDVLKANTVSQVHLRTTYKDRAEGFNTKVRWLSFVLAVTVSIAVVNLRDVPWMSWTLAMYFVTTFCLTWTIAYIVDTINSPDGNVLMHTLLGWWFVFREQNERHKRMRG